VAAPYGSGGEVSRAEGQLSTGEAIRGPSRSSIALDPEPAAQIDPTSPLLGRTLNGG